MIPTKIWTDYIPDIPSFHYEFKIKVNIQNWKEKGIAFDKHFLEMGKKYKLFYYKNIGFNLYKDSSILPCYTETDPMISLGLFHKILNKKNRNFLDAYIDLPEIQGNKIVFIPTCYHQPFVNLRIIQFSYEALFVEELRKSEEKDLELTLSIFSSSNIWWEEIGFTLESEQNTPLVIFPPADNRRIAHKMTPRWNSFLRDLRKKTVELGGTVLLQEDYVQKYVTIEGILLDGDLKYE